MFWVTSLYERYITMKEKNKKTEYITLRCTKKEKELLERKSKNQGKAISEYVLDCAIAGTERRRCRDRNHIVSKIENQEIIPKLDVNPDDICFNKNNEKAAVYIHIGISLVIVLRYVSMEQEIKMILKN